MTARETVNNSDILDGKRRSARTDYDTTLRIAPFDGENIPTFYAFTVVRGRDISTSGISFYSAERPESNSLILMLGEKPNLIYVVGEVRHLCEGYYDRQRQFLIGVEFIRKL